MMLFGMVMRVIVRIIGGEYGFMFIDDTCKDWDVRVVGDGKCVQFCRVDGKVLRNGKDCNTCRRFKDQTRLI
jgi:hypothetical protein